MSIHALSKLAVRRRNASGSGKKRSQVYASIVVASVACALLVETSGCHRQRNSTTDQKTIGISLLTKQHPFYRELERGLVDAAKKHNFRLLIRAGEWDLSRHHAQIEDFIVQHVDAIVVAPNDSKGIGPAIEKANAAGIPVFTTDISAAAGKIVSHIASDNRAGGRLAAEFLARQIGGAGSVAIIDQPYIQSVQERVAGFEDGLKQFPNIKIVARLNGDGVRDRAANAAEDLLQAHPEVNGLFAINDDSALGTLSVLEARGRREIALVGYDATDEARAAIRRGAALKGDVVQDPYTMGGTTIDIIAKHFRGESVPAFVPIPVAILDQAKLNR
jgi:ribose transport system substrate-binding protein